MDLSKCRALKERLGPEFDGQVVPVTEFFEGNDDLGSIGCNLNPHPGIDSFRDTLAGLLSRPDVEAAYAIIAELDPGEGCWPFADTVAVVGNISVADLGNIVQHLEPDEVRVFEADRIPNAITERHNAPVLVVWWD